MMDTVEAGTLPIRKLAEPLGAEITGIDVGRPMSDATFKRIEDAFHEHCVLVFRKQRLIPEGHTAFSRRFGELLVHMLRQYNDPQVPDVLVLSNFVKNGKPIGMHLTIGHSEER
jgi:taurine dioxygenase